MSGSGPAPFDYDSNPQRFRTGSESAWKYGLGDVHEAVARRFVDEGLNPLLDLGCGEGRLYKLLVDRGLSAVGADLSREMLSAFRGKRVRADASALPARDEAFGGVAALYMLYHLADPSIAIKEAHRVTRWGGLFVAAAPSLHTDPEFAELFPPAASTFDAEIAPALVRDIFGDAEVESWDGPYITLPTRSAVAEYLFGRGMEKSKSRDLARQLDVPLTVTKRGCLVWARKDG